MNFDNAATSFPKPPQVKKAVVSALNVYGGNPGRGGHRLSVVTAEQVYKTREAAAKLFGAVPENTIFTANATIALNMAIKGLMSGGGHIIITDYEHNAVLRPVYALSKNRNYPSTVSFSIAHVYDEDEQTIDGIRRLIRNDTKCICCMTASNVTGRILPYKAVAALCRSYGIPLVVDATQGAGVLTLDMSAGMSFLCTAGHKSLYGPSGTGLLISSGEYPLTTIIEGGTGATSAEARQTPYLPEQLESGTMNTMGVIGLAAGIEFVSSKTPERILSYETKLCRRLEDGISGLPGVKLYTSKNKVPITAFNIGNMDSQEVSAKLSDMGFALRGGLHCSALAHKTLGTLEQGAVRFSPGAFNTPQQTDSLIKAIRKISYGS